MSDAYGFAFNDRLTHPLASFDSGSLLKITLLPDDPTPTIPPILGAVVNAATYQTTVAPGSIAAAFGFLPATVTASAPGNPVLPVQLAGVGLDFAGGLCAPLLYASPSQVNLQVPWEVLPTFGTFVSVRGLDTIGGFVTVAQFAPGIFTAAPEPPGTLQIYATGLGPVTNQPPTGAVTPSSPLSQTLTTPVVNVGGTPATVTFSGLAAGYVGVYRVTLQVPASVKGFVPVTISHRGCHVESFQRDHPIAAMSSTHAGEFSR